MSRAGSAPARVRVDVHTRRARLVARHHLGRTAPDVGAAVRDLVAVHSSDPITPHLALRARVGGYSVADLDRALHDERSLWRMHAMRRTLFVVPAEEAGVVAAACGADVARAERRKVERWVAEALGLADPRAWLADVEQRTVDLLADGVPRRTQDLTTAVEELSLRLTVGSGRWAGKTPLSSRLLFLLAMDGRVVRAHPAGSWRSSQYHWVESRAWFAGRDVPFEPVHGEPVDADAARARLAGSWLRAHGPATAADLRWWTGWTARRTQAALAAVEAVEVDLGDGEVGWVLPNDLDELAAPHELSAQVEGSGTVALLPGLDPTAMGWAARDWYLGDHGPRLFDRNGNAGPTVWLDGRVVGGWAQRPDGQVVTRLLEDVGAEAAERVDVEAAELTRWCAGEVATPRFRTPLERELSG